MLDKSETYETGNRKIEDISKRFPSKGTFGDLHLIAILNAKRNTRRPCALRRYEFIVYTERPLIHIRKLIVPAVNYSACTAATAAAKPHVQLASVQAPFQSEYASSR